jgi:hypothetical protein
MARRLSVGETLGEIFATYGARAGVLLPVAFWLFLIVAIIDGVGGSSLALLPLELVVSTVVGTLYQGVVVNLVRDLQEGRAETPAGDLVRAALPFVWPLILVGVLSGIAIAVGFFALLVPGLILVTIWAVIAPVIVIEQAGVMESFGRSRELVRGSGWPVFGVVVVSYLITAAGALVFGGIANGIAGGVPLRIVFGALASTITAPIPALAAAILYYRLRGIEGAASPPASPPPVA